jgi:energy-coupling factor transport system ATP-binding protein
MIDFSDVWFDYRPDEAPRSSWALRGINLHIAAGEFVSIIGQNGSGKSTLARLMNGLLTPCEGSVTIAGRLHTSCEDHHDAIHQHVGLVFQNPDNQIVGPLVADDIAFGMENIGLERAEMQKRMQWVLKELALEELADHPCHQLSGGQKQRLAIACLLAMYPQVMVFDEVTSMLDASSRKSVRRAMIEQSQRQEITLVEITHTLADVFDADRVLVMDQGQIVLDFPPDQLLRYAEPLVKLGFVLPVFLQVAERLQAEGWPLPSSLQREKDLVNAICTYLSKT